MRYDDPVRPRSMSADGPPLQVNGSPLPAVVLIRPMASTVLVARCSMSTSFEAHCNRAQKDWTPCERCDHVNEEKVGWLACIHAHREGSRFGYHTGFIADLAQFHEEFLAGPEEALARYFGYHGPEGAGGAHGATAAREAKAQVTEGDLWD